MAKSFWTRRLRLTLHLYARHQASLAKADVAEGPVVVVEAAAEAQKREQPKMRTVTEIGIHCRASIK
jgi:hypothetical protein